MDLRDALASLLLVFYPSFSSASVPAQPWPPLPIATAPSRPLGSGSFSSLLEPIPTHRGRFILSAVLGPRSS